MPYNAVQTHRKVRGVILACKLLYFIVVAKYAFIRLQHELIVCIYFKEELLWQ